MPRGVVLGVVAWVGVVVAGSTMTWAAINTAGQQVLSRGDVPTARATSVRTTHVPRPTEDPTAT
ncbi:MAG: hypothetical protein HOQ45_06245, partial [Nocardioidaceae bacterium]|nr:hypothetical protein [Nocardioidaceae bacterium]